MGFPRTVVLLLGVACLANPPWAPLRAAEARAPAFDVVHQADPGTAGFDLDRVPAELDEPTPLSNAVGTVAWGAAVDGTASLDRPSVAVASGAPQITIGPRLADAIGGLAQPLPVPPVEASPVTAAEPAANAPPAGSEPSPTAAADAPVADPLVAAIESRLADLKGGWPPRLAGKDREAVAAFYTGGGFHPLWISVQGWTASGEAVLDRLRRADEDGLDVADYAVSASAGSDPAAIASADVRLSAAALLYARDARGGRINPSRLSSLITPKLEFPDAEAVLSGLVAATDAGGALEAYNPAYPGYQALKAKLSDLRAARAADPMAALPPAPVLPARRLASLERPRRTPRLEGDLVANMERWRWLPPEVAPRYVFVNIPAFRLDLVEDGRVVHETRVIAGKADTPTPLFSSEMETAVVNPSWFIPPSILKKEILPGLAADPLYAAKRGYKVVRHGNQISVRQPPGERNALGFIKFLFPNQHAVYLHDTPNRNLFAASRRAFSHGCVRVEHPFALADFVLGAAWTEARLRKLIGHGERTIRLPEKLPVHLAYFTTMVDEFGEVRSYDDIYGINRRVRTALGFGN